MEVSLGRVVLGRFGVWFITQVHYLDGTIKHKMPQQLMRPKFKIQQIMENNATRFGGS